MSRAQQIVNVLLESLNRRSFLGALAKGAAAAVITGSGLPSTSRPSAKYLKSKVFPPLPYSPTRPKYSMADPRIEKWQNLYLKTTELFSSEVKKMQDKYGYSAFQDSFMNNIMAPTPEWSAWFDANIPSVRKAKAPEEASAPETAAPRQSRKRAAKRVWPPKPPRDQDEDAWFDKVPESKAQQIVSSLLEEEEEIAVDLDGTLAKDSGWKGISHIGDPVPSMLKRVQKWIDAGKKVVIFTARAHDEKAIPHVEKWLKKHGLPKLEVTNEKRPSMVQFYDDKAKAVRKNKGTVKL